MVFSLMDLHMMTSSNGNIFRVTGTLCGEFTGPGEFPAQRPVTRSFDVFFDLRPNKRLSKQSWGWWFETPSRSLCRHCNDSIGSKIKHHLGDPSVEFGISQKPRRRKTLKILRTCSSKCIDWMNELWINCKAVKFINIKRNYSRRLPLQDILLLSMACWSSSEDFSPHVWYRHCIIVTHEKKSASNCCQLERVLNRACSGWQQRKYSSSLLALHCKAQRASNANGFS